MELFSTIMTQPMSNEQFVAQLPQKRMAVGVLFLNTAHEMLIVKPTYREEWLVPGGCVEQNESPRIAALREVHEELGLAVHITRLLCVDYRPAETHKTESVHFIFAGGILHTPDIAQIHLPPDEISTYCFLAPSTALPLLDHHLQRRIESSLVALESDMTLYLENGVRVG